MPKSLKEALVECIEHFRSLQFDDATLVRLVEEMPFLYEHHESFCKDLRCRVHNLNKKVPRLNLVPAPKARMPVSIRGAKQTSNSLLVNAQKLIANNEYHLLSATHLLALFQKEFAAAGFGDYPYLVKDVGVLSQLLRQWDARRILLGIPYYIAQHKVYFPRDPFPKISLLALKQVEVFNSVGKEGINGPRSEKSSGAAVTTWD